MADVLKKENYSVHLNNISQYISQPVVPMEQIFMTIIITALYMCCTKNKRLHQVLKYNHQFLKHRVWHAKIL